MGNKDCVKLDWTIIIRLIIFNCIYGEQGVIMPISSTNNTPNELLTFGGSNYLKYM
jgi:hypothetical protein